MCGKLVERNIKANKKLNLPVRPVKGYSLTYETAGLNNQPNISLVDESIHTAVTPFENRIRVAGTAEFVNFDNNIHPEREKYLNDMLESIYPNLYSQIDKTTGKLWHGFRPMSADGLPFTRKNFCQRIVSKLWPRSFRMDSCNGLSCIASRSIIGYKIRYKF